MSAPARGALAILVLAGVVAVGADVFPHGPERVRTEAGVEVLRPPSWRHVLGTDDRGRDVAARLAHGSRTSLMLAAGALIVALFAGGIAGGVAATRGGAVDAAVVAACDALVALPAPLVVVGVQGLVGRASFVALIGLIALAPAAYVARVVRGEVAAVLATPFAEAARALGASNVEVAARHALPFVRPQLMAAAANTIASAVLAEAALTFLGFGVPVGTPSWGDLLRQAHQNGLVWWLVLPAGAAVTIITLAAQILADELGGGLRRPRRPS